VNIDIEKIIGSITPVSVEKFAQAQRHLDSLTKPPGSLGRLEELGGRYAAIKGLDSPQVRKKAVYVFAGDHGVAQQGISAFPAEVTPQMVLNFINGGAAINVLANHFDAEVVVVDMGVNFDFEEIPNLLNKKIALGTGDLSLGPSMTRLQAEKAVQVGMELACEAAERGVDILGTGDMGIANTTASVAIIAALTQRPVKEITGRGTGIDDKTLQKKIDIVEKALQVNQPDSNDPLDVLAKVGGFEIAGISGFILGSAASRTPVVIDGVISGAGALIAHRLNPATGDYMFMSHRSREPAHEVIFDQVQQEALFDFGMRLGEGTGAIIGMNLLEAGVKIFSEMATFENAGVSNKNIDEG
jgi:nicotinate-nucleotide--dimethylbenzimidazole phosphoribosyltransferase